MKHELLYVSQGPSLFGLLTRARELNLKHHVHLVRPTSAEDIDGLLLGREEIEACLVRQLIAHYYLLIEAGVKVSV